ncbi:hypothetical protein NPIL_523601 [Nephila pilipes]|uniref:TFIID subunit TAF5 NTD2 domain-containing protein n=1 Tax=Nephila pilipes TaxID=299642 RepID=A0A8X6PJY6_NEPPI|nr:hypothetical protein NPIL_523601 [Nephila pilipes]
MAEKEYEGLLKFIKKTAEPVKSQLVGFVFPLYVYIYLIFLRQNRLLEAQKFISKYSKQFLNAGGFTEVFEELQKFKTYHEPQCHPYFKIFCENKYLIKAPEDSLKLLKTYLQEAQCRILVTILHCQFHIKFIENESNSNEELENSVIVNDKNNSNDVNVETEINSNDVNVNDENNSNSVNVKTEINSNGESSETPEDLHSSLSGVAGKEHEVSRKESSNHFYTISCGKINMCSVDIDKDIKFLACGFENSKIYVWNIDSNSTNLLKRTMKKTVKSELDDQRTDEDCPTELRGILKGHQDSVYGLSYSSVHDLLLSCSGDSTVRAWSTKNFETVDVYSEHEYPIWDVSVSPNCAYFATASMDHTARLWSFEHNQSLRIFAGHSSDVDCVKFHPHSRYLATASADKVILLWTFDDAQSVRQFVGHKTFINSLAFAPNGREMASADYGGNIIIWNLESGKILKSIPAHTGRILSISYDKNGSFIASGGCDHFLRVWDINFHAAEEGIPERIQSLGQVDSYDLNSVLHHVSFLKNRVLIVGSSTRSHN